MNLTSPIIPDGRPSCNPPEDRPIGQSTGLPIDGPLARRAADDALRLCPQCGKPGARSGELHRERPDGPLLCPPVEILHCTACRVWFRVDGVPYNEAAHSQMWQQYRERTEGWTLFDKEEAK